jgi:prepilin-type N-terminal cleavage/methylation domain-containing protein
MKIMKRGFTLIEAMAVVSIIGILAATATYAYVNLTSRSRDARRKSDLTAISLGFQARHDTLTCSSQMDIGKYPGQEYLSTDHWKSVGGLSSTSDSCGAFSEFLTTIPTDPTKQGNPYKFDLSREGTGGTIIGKHYRLTAVLERVITAGSQEEADLARAVSLWQTSFGGALLPDGYNYIIGN